MTLEHGIWSAWTVVAHVGGDKVPLFSLSTIRVHMVSRWFLCSSTLADPHYRKMECELWVISAPMTSEVPLAKVTGPL